jgi:hypothetical protein
MREEQLGVSGEGNLEVNPFWNGEGIKQNMVFGLKHRSLLCSEIKCIQQNFLGEDLTWGEDAGTCPPPCCTA